MCSLYTKWKRMSSLAGRALSAGSDLVPRPDQVAAMRLRIDVVEDDVVAEERRRRQIEVVAAGARLLRCADGFVHPADVTLVGVDDRPAHRRAVAGHDEVLSLIHISEPTRLGMISYAVFC